MRRLFALVAAVALVPLAAFAPAHAGAAPRAGTPTVKVVVRPVHRDGTPVAGWTVKRDRGYSVGCSGPAPSSKSWGIVECFPSAAYLPACWKSTRHTVLCLRDATEKRLVRVRYTGSLQQRRKPALPSPLDMTLADGQFCALRVGGAWGSIPSHPRWVGFYACTKDSVYGPTSGDGVIRRTTPWQVRLWDGTSDTTHRVGVTTAYYVGTAA